MPEGTRLVTRAVRFAAERHADQRRKGLRQRPYFNHLAEVADLLSEATGGDDTALIAAAYLHDTIEDTQTGPDELREQFGADITSLVMEVTDDKSLPKMERKRLQIATAPKKSPRAKLLKIADATSNVRTLALDPPTDWGADRMQDYVDWAGQVISHCRGLNPILDTAFDTATAEARAAISARMAEGAKA
ncbi:bifunctional (p)ppGpp synthetase/guanosine-3',5'-bis(diphosphate) 3'-pyrophosphohydrolase [Bradyrhizobium jicamae]|uniref:Bifunctional (P)ppGpp synthetase/guanosine-3',5'-bis(Diphosphate) 3'-pyrophosphohydrolase n=1 Tax=Bradyrhizobium jicamae TaxID=280332 RepID=A0ABS5FM14_9BRAD|nr:HD domain-containing protein [Bradyrhizobium jicamae]MBR0797810.1 bifunctional (p)ppGpp synthetase/guanosine-3',5'-bis(diphosphate) 3'-pyrophosphohydrolase [Bradyrhizobium jicamae]MBR0935994.1 bifunctional (p)ppGpp synthetase/guanosine-3',5'-bis(diphosphate) 3'-pyrophosphohydrolase [Bradyrhizobium jicamae]